jgi:thioredoxin-like negative regulator of GroEL
MMPIVNGLEEEFAGEINIARLNVGDGDHAALQTQYGLRGHPSFVVLDDGGAIAERFFGPQSAETLRAAMEQVLEPSS